MVAAVLCQQRGKVGCRHSEDGRERLRLINRVGNLEVVSDDRLGWHGHRQHCAVSVVDPSTHGGDRDRPPQLELGRVLILVVSTDLDVDESNGDHEQHHKDDRFEASNALSARRQGLVLRDPRGCLTTGRSR